MADISREIAEAMESCVAWPDGYFDVEEAEQIIRDKLGEREAKVRKVLAAWEAWDSTRPVKSWQLMDAAIKALEALK